MSDVTIIICVILICVTYLIGKVIDGAMAQRIE